MASSFADPTGFSDGTVESAANEASKGGACEADPPLRLTISVSGKLI